MTLIYDLGMSAMMETFTLAKMIQFTLATMLIMMYAVF